MGIFSSLQNLFGFTRNEIKVILFLTVTFLAGLSIRGFRFMSDPGDSPSTDYSHQDSIFIARSRALLSDTADQADQQRGLAGSDQRRNEIQPGSLDLNSATKNELMKLPGIGAAYSERIIAYRQRHGPFKSLDELEHVKGIGKKTVQRISVFVDLSRLSESRSPP